MRNIYRCACGAEIELCEGSEARIARRLEAVPDGLPYMVSAQQLAEGERLPHGYAVAYWDWRTGYAVAWPWGIAHLVGLVRRVYQWSLTVMGKSDREHQAWTAGYVAAARAFAMTKR